MLNNISLGNAIKAIDWVVGTAASGVGKSIIESTPFAIDIPKVDYLDLRFEVQFTQRKTGGSGQLRSWVKFFNQGTELALVSNESGGLRYSTVVHTIDAAVVRKLTFNFEVWQAPLRYSDYFEINVGSVGTEADTAWTVDNIKARFLYTQMGA